MTFGATPTTGSQGSLGTNQFPLSSVAVPGNTNGDLTALEGGPISTDSNSNKTAPASVYVKDGGSVAQGATTDAANANTVVGQLKQIKTNTASVVVGTLPTLPAGTNVIGHVIVDSASSVAISSLPALSAGSNLIGNVELVDSGGTNKAAISAGGALKVDASATTQPVSAASLPLPTGAATTAKQPALGTAGSASSDVISVQGIASMTALKVDGSGVTQPVSGTVTANAGTNLNTSLLALESGGNLATLAGGISSSKYQVNIAQTLGATLSNTNPLLMEANLQNWLRNAQIFTVTTGAQTGASQTSAACLFNSSTAKSAFIFSVFVMNSNPGQGVYTSLRKVTTNPAFTNAVTPVCTVLSSGNTSLMTPTWQASASVTGTDIGTDNFNGGTNSKEMLQTGTIVGRGFLLANGANAGLSVYVGQGGTGGFWSVTYTYAEF